MAAGGHAHRQVKNGIELRRCGIDHRPRRIIHRSDGHAGENQCDIVLRGHLPAPFHILQPHDPLPREHIGPGALEPRRLVGAVKIDQQPVPGRFLGDLPVIVDHPLVIPLHEIDLDALDAPAGKTGQGRLQLVEQALPGDPENDLHLALASMRQQLLHIDLRMDGEKIPELIPALVEDDIFNTVVGGKIDIVLVGGCVEAGLEIDAIEIEGVPPVPGHLAGLDPGGVRDLFRLRELVDQRIADDFGIPAGDDQQAPGITAAAGGLGNILSAGERLDITIRGDGVGQTDLRKAADQRGRTLVAAGEPEPRIIAEVRLADQHFGA